MTDKFIAVQGLSTGYGQTPVLNGLDLSVSLNEIVAVLGPNGSGKSTLLKTICGVLRPWKGLVSVEGQDIHSLSPIKRARLVSYVPQSEPQVFGFTVLELTLMGRHSQSPRLFENEDDLLAAETAMQETDCAHLANRKVNELSGGESQRALVARALAQGAPALLCDEPSSHLDPCHVTSVIKLLRALAHSGKAVLITSHDLNFANACADRVVMLKGGQSFFQGSLTDAFESGALEDTYDSKFCRHGDLFYPAN
ncbi:MAG: ABC transporter ATP-binding protein [Chthonomonadaceae bacterium]|nr:ABC transporter ATP-binding protein [Chthonomonadaceae bacterium]